MTAHRVATGEPLTAREFSVLKGMALGKQNKEIGQEL